MCGQNRHHHRAGMEVQDLIPWTSRTRQSTWKPSWPPCTAAWSWKTTPAGPVTEVFAREVAWTCQARIPFNSQTKWSAAVFADQGAFVVGAPEFILGPRYASIQASVEPWFPPWAVGCCWWPSSGGTPEQNRALEPELVRPMALVLLSNRIRATAPDTFRFFAQEGVSIRVISGDNPVTSLEVARRAGIAGSRAVAWTPPP
ncbi:MAG: hypothetical protein ACLU9S_21170 [Oscillospiraceae bacterium]